MSQKLLEGDVLKKALGVAQFLFLIIASWATSEIRNATDSINKLNVTIAQLLTDMSNQKQTVDKLDERVRDLETSYRKYK